MNQLLFPRYSGVQLRYLKECIGNIGCVMMATNGSRKFEYTGWLIESKYLVRKLVSSTQ